MAKRREKARMRSTAAGSASVIKNSNIRALTLDTPVACLDGSTEIHNFSVTDGFLEALNCLVLDLLSHCMTVAVQEDRTRLVASDIPTFTELMHAEVEEVQRTKEIE